MHLHVLFRDQRLSIFEYTPIVIYCFQNHIDEKADNAWYKSPLNWHWATVQDENLWLIPVCSVWLGLGYFSYLRSYPSHLIRESTLCFRTECFTKSRSTSVRQQVSGKGKYIIYVFIGQILNQHSYIAQLFVLYFVTIATVSSIAGYI